MPAASKKKKALLSMWGVVAIGYFNVCGGAWGSEQIISAGGPAVGLATLLIFPFIWALPVASITAELSTAFPEDGGYTVWVKEAYGPFWGFQEGYWSWISGVVDNAIYPVLGMDIATAIWGDIEPVTGYFVRLAVATLLTIPNVLGIELVERGLIVLGVLILIPFTIFTVAALPGMDWSVLGEAKPLADVDWALLFSAAFWNLTGWDGVSTMAGEVASPGRTYPRALLITVVLVVLTYLLPLSVAAGNNTPQWSSWDDGDFSKIAEESVGLWLGDWIVVASAFGSVGLFMTELMVDSYQLYGMAQLGLAPDCFARRHPKFDTPVNAILASYVIIAFLVALDFNSILAIDNFLSSLSVVLILMSAYKLRKTHPHVERPYRVPGSDRVIVYISIMPCFVTAYMLYSSYLTSVTSFVVSTASVVLGLLAWLALNRAKRRARSSFVWDGVSTPAAEDGAAADQVIPSPTSPQEAVAAVADGVAPQGTEEGGYGRL